MTDVPTLMTNPFDEAFLADPYAHHDALRDAGPVVWLDSIGFYGMARYAEVQATLKDHRSFCSARGVGLSDFAKEEPWRPASLLLEADPPLHDRTRALATFPEEWEKLRERPALGRGVFDESLRWDSTVQTFFRTTTRDATVAGVTIPEGSKVLLFLAAANRDPRYWTNPERFDIERKNFGHVGFGFGVHQCLGQMVARQEAELVLNALLTRVHSIRVAGRVTRRLNNTLHAIESLPIEVYPV